jgi:hypothetical protein
LGSLGASLAAALGALVFVGQIVGKWAEGGWVVSISFSVLILTANFILLSRFGYRARESARARQHGRDCRVAIAQDARVSLQIARHNCQLEFRLF